MEFDLYIHVPGGCVLVVGGGAEQANPVQPVVLQPFALMLTQEAMDLIRAE